MMNKDKAIEEAMASIENRIRHVYNQGFEDGYAKGKELKKCQEYEEEIVRCKDCRFYHPTYCEMWSKFGTIMTAENGFCYWGKEKSMDELIKKQDAIDAVDTIGFDFSNCDLSQVEQEELCEAIGEVIQTLVHRISDVPPCTAMDSMLREIARRRGRVFGDIRFFLGQRNRNGRLVQRRMGKSQLSCDSSMDGAT